MNSAFFNDSETKLPILLTGDRPILLHTSVHSVFHLFQAFLVLLPIVGHVLFQRIAIFGEVDAGPIEGGNVQLVDRL